MVPSNAVNSHFTAVIQDESYNTCAVFGPLFGASWYTDFIIPLYYINKTEIVTVELFGENIGCSSDDDAKFYLFPISTWNESTDLLGRRETCKFHESSIDVGTGQQKCAYRCQYSYNSKALRIIKMPYNETQSEWKLCEVTNLFYENPVCRMGPIGLIGGNRDDNRECWITSGRRFPTGLLFNVGSFLIGFNVSYGDTNCTFGNLNRTGIKTYVELDADELITEVTFYQDENKVNSNYTGFVGLEIKTNYGNVYEA
ncbi:hypothetical protein LSH36_1544g00005, partial [Paralvinella palmiformis]